MQSDTEFQEPDEFIENLQKELTRLIEGFRHVKSLSDGDRSKLAPIEKSLKETLVLVGLTKQNMEIPDLCLQINPHIHQIVYAARIGNRKPKPG